MHIHQPRRRHAQQADPGKGQRTHLGQANRQIDEEKRQRRQQAHGQQIKHAIARHATVESGQPSTADAQHPGAQQIARHQHGQGRAQRGREQGHCSAPGQAQHGATGQAQQRCAWQRQSRHRNIHAGKRQPRLPGTLRVPLQQAALLGQQGLQTQAAQPTGPDQPSQHSQQDRQRQTRRAPEGTGRRRGAFGQQGHGGRSGQSWRSSGRARKAL